LAKGLPSFDEVPAINYDAPGRKEKKRLVDRWINEVLRPEVAAVVTRGRLTGWWTDAYDLRRLWKSLSSASPWRVSSACSWSLSSTAGARPDRQSVPRRPLTLKLYREFLASGSFARPS